MFPTQDNCNKVNKIKKLPVFDEEKDLQKFLETNFTESLKQMIRVSVKVMVKEEMETMRGEFENERKCYFNGSYPRNMVSSFGMIEDVPVPRFRESIEGMKLNSLSVFESEQQRFFKLIEQMHLMGISLRKIKKLAELCFGVTISKDRAGAIYRELADKEDININRSKLDDDFEYLLFDGIWEKTKGYGWDKNDTVLLCALGIRPNGERKIIGFLLARAEDTTSWQKLLESIRTRGLKGKKLKLVIGDDTQALRTAASVIYPQTSFQLCIVHKMRNVQKNTQYKNRSAVSADLSEIFKSKTRDEAMAKAKQTVKKWYVSEPRAMESLRHNIEYCFTYFAFPESQWTKVRTTNILEREFRELRRRMKVFDNTFQNEDSANRYANSILNYLNENYPHKQSLHTKA